MSAEHDFFRFVGNFWAFQRDLFPSSRTRNQHGIVIQEELLTETLPAAESDGVHRSKQALAIGLEDPTGCLSSNCPKWGTTRRM